MGGSGDGRIPAGGRDPPGGGGSGAGSSSGWNPGGRGPSPLEDSLWLVASYLLKGQWASKFGPGCFNEVVTQDVFGGLDGTAIFHVEHVHPLSNDGAFIEVCYCGASNRVTASEFEHAFLLEPALRAALHFCSSRMGMCPGVLAGRPIACSAGQAAGPTWDHGALVLCCSSIRPCGGRS